MSENSASKDFNPINNNLDKIPYILYKYRTFDDKGYGIDMAINGNVYFASRKEINDPFECYFIPRSKISEYEGEELEKYLESRAHFHFKSASRQEINDFIQVGITQKEKLLKGDPTAMDAVMEVQY
jgi:hypothetical protein